MRLLSIFLLMIFTYFSYAEDQSLIDTLTYRDNGDFYELPGREFIKEMKSIGMFSSKPDFEMDYSDYYLPQKPLSFYGHEVVLFDIEEAGVFIGCCPNPGHAILISVNGPSNVIEEFAKNNICQVENVSSVYLPSELEDVLNMSDNKDYIMLNCKTDYRHR